MSKASSETVERVRSAASGDDEAFRQLVREVHPTLRRWALGRTGDSDDADEVVQRALIRMHRSLHTFTGDSRLTSWLYRIVANAAIDVRRSSGAPRSDTAPGAGVGTATATAATTRGGAAAGARGSVTGRGGGGAGPRTVRLDPDHAAEPGPDPARRIDAGRMAASVRDFFEELPPRQREVLELVDHQGMRAVDVAEALGIRPVSVRANLLKARRKVRRAILSRYPELTEGYEP